MNIETIFTFLILLVQLCVIFTVAAVIADKIVDPLVKRWTR